MTTEDYVGYDLPERHPERESYRMSGFDDAINFVMSSDETSAGHYRPPPSADGCRSCGEEGEILRLPPALGCPRCEYDDGWNDGMCK
jgi:hypothetical protein